MKSELTTTSLKRTLLFPFQGRGWENRFLTGAALSLAAIMVPLLPLIFVYGYLLRIMRLAASGEDLALPAWEDWGSLATDGLRSIAVWLVFLAPGGLVLFGGMAVYFVTALSMPFMAAAGEGGRGAASFPFALLAGMGIMFLSMMVGTLLIAVGAIPLPVAMAHFVVKDEWSAAFRVREWWPLLWTNKMGYFVAWVVLVGLMGIYYFLSMLANYTVVLCCAPLLLGAPVGFYLGLVGASLFGATYRESQLALFPGDYVDEEE